MDSKTTLIFLCLFASCIHEQTDAEFNIYGDSCKIWLLYDERFMPIVLCFGEDDYQDYKIKNNGRLVKRDSFVYSEQVFRGGKWVIKNKCLVLNGYQTPIQSLLTDTIKLGRNEFLLNVSNKFYINNCNCQTLDATFKGGKIDSIKTILQYK